MKGETAEVLSVGVSDVCGSGFVGDGCLGVGVVVVVVVVGQHCHTMRYTMNTFLQWTQLGVGVG